MKRLSFTWRVCVLQGVGVQREGGVASGGPHEGRGGDDVLLDGHRLPALPAVSTSTIVSTCPHVLTDSMDLMWSRLKIQAEHKKRYVRVRSYVDAWHLLWSCVFPFRHLATAATAGAGEHSWMPDLKNVTVRAAVTLSLAWRNRIIPPMTMSVALMAMFCV
jgi:hypothetical protein